MVGSYFSDAERGASEGAGAPTPLPSGCAVTRTEPKLPSPALRADPVSRPSPGTARFAFEEGKPSGLPCGAGAGEGRARGPRGTPTAAGRSRRGMRSSREGRALGTRTPAGRTERLVPRPGCALRFRKSGNARRPNDKNRLPFKPKGCFSGTHKGLRFCFSDSSPPSRILGPLLGFISVPALWRKQLIGCVPIKT